MSIMPKDMQTSDIYNQLALVSGLSDQQLAQAAQNPEYGWMAGIVAADRAQMRVPNPPQPQGTVIGNKLAQLQAPQGLPAGMANQQAMMGAAQANPMQAGIGGAPENVPGAATGGLMALAQGGPVRGFSGEEDSWVNMIPHTESGTNIYDTDYSPMGLARATGDLNQYLGSKIYHGVTELPPIKAAIERWGKRLAKAEDVQEGRSSYDPEEQRIMDLPATIQKKIAAGEPLNRPEDVAAKDEETGATKTPKAEPLKEAKEGVKKVSTSAAGIPAAGRQTSNVEGTEGFVGPAAPAGIRSLVNQEYLTRQAGGGREGIYRAINDPEVSTEKSIQAIQEALGTPYAMSAELKGQIEKAQAESEQGRWLRAGLAALGTAMAAPTERAGKALGMGLVAGVNQFQQETDPEKLRNVMLEGQAQGEQGQAAYRHEAGLEALKQRAARSAKSEEHQFQLLKQSMGDRAKILAAEIRATGQAKTPQEFEDKLVEKLTGIYGTTLPPSEIRSYARQLSNSTGGTYAGGDTTGMRPLGRLTSSGGLQLFNAAG